MAMTFADAREIFTTARMFKEDLPDGMWDCLEEAFEFFKDSDRSPDAKEQFATDIEEITKDFGFPCFT